MLQDNYYSKSLSLIGVSSTLTVTVIIDDLAQWKADVENAENLDPNIELTARFHCILEYVAENLQIKQAGSISAHSEAVYDLLDNLRGFAGQLRQLYEYI